MKALICTDCGAFIGGEPAFCPSCNATVSTFASTNLSQNNAGLSQNNAGPLLLTDLELSPAILESTLVQSAQYIQRLTPRTSVEEVVNKRRADLLSVKHAGTPLVVPLPAKEEPSDNSTTGQEMALASSTAPESARYREQVSSIQADIFSVPFDNSLPTDSHKVQASLVHSSTQAKNDDFFASPPVNGNGDFFTDLPAPTISSSMEASTSVQPFATSAKSPLYAPDYAPDLPLDGGYDDIRRNEAKITETKLVDHRTAAKVDAGKEDSDKAPERSNIDEANANDDAAEGDKELHEAQLQAHSNTTKIARRSFSGRPSEESRSKVNKIDSSGKTLSADDADDEENEVPIKKNAPQFGWTNFFSRVFFHQENEPTSNKLKLLLPFALATLALIVAFSAFCSVGNLLLHNFGVGSRSGQGSLSGRWQYAAKTGSLECRGVMVLQQRGNQIFGAGADTPGGNYRLTGSRNGSQIELSKQYYGSRPVIALHGELEPDSRPPFLSGDFNLEFMQGNKWRGKTIAISGNWEAQMLQALDDNSLPDLAAKPIAKASSINSLAQNGIYIALGVIILAVFVLWGMRALFSPDGLRGIKDKNMYIPRQFMAQHQKELRELGKPVVPGGLPLGLRVEWRPWAFWTAKAIALPPAIRDNNPHVLILGGGEKGKSRLMANMITHDIESYDRAVVVVDSDGGLAELLMRWIAAHPNGKALAKRVSIIDPTYSGRLPAYNPLEMPEDGDLQSAASAVVYGFKAIYTEPPGSQTKWDRQTADILLNAALLLMVNGKTLLDLPNLLQDNDFRDILLERLTTKPEYAPLLESWSRYKRTARTEQWINWIEPILNRINPVLIDPRFRSILTNPVSDINLKQIISEKRVLIVSIPKGQLEEKANLLGSLIVTGLKQAAISICAAGKLKQRKVALYLDEFDNFIDKETLDAIATETKKFQLSFCGAVKTLQHLPEDFRNQLVINMSVMCVFALSKKDGDMLGPQMFRVSGRKKKHETLMNFINPINTSPQFEFISDEEKFNIDRILGQQNRHFFCYRVGAVAGTFQLRSPTFNDVPESQVNAKLIEKMYNARNVLSQSDGKS